MSLPHAILGLLAQQPLTGYELKTAWFDRTIAHFWAADHTQIYRTLEKLAEQEWVTVEVELSPDHPTRKVYHLTEAGRAELNAWLRTRQPSPVVRDPLQIQLFCGAPLSNAELEQLLEAERALQRQRLTAYQQQQAGMEHRGDTSRGAQLRLLTLRRGIRRVQDALAWLDEALATVNQLPDDPA